MSRLIEYLGQLKMSTADIAFVSYGIGLFMGIVLGILLW